MSSDYYSCTVKRGLSLYHVELLSTEEILDGVNVPMTLKKYKLTSPAIFGITEYYTIYYDTIYHEALLTPRRLHYEVFKDLKLLMVNKPIDHKKIEELNYDGLVIESPESWKRCIEITLFHPEKCVRFIRELYHEAVQIVEYPSEIDKVILDAYTKR